MVNFCKGVEDWKTWGKVRETFGKTRINKGSTVTALIDFFFFFWRASAQDSDQVLMSSRGIVMIETYLEVLLHEKVCFFANSSASKLQAFLDLTKLMLSSKTLAMQTI